MRIGVAIRLLTAPGGRWPLPTWDDIREQAVVAEDTGFDRVVIEDALSWPLEDITGGAWESVSLLGGLAEATSTIGLAHSVINAPYRAPGLIAKIAETLDEMSDGRFVLGLGAGNTPDADYTAFGIPADPRFSRFAESLEIIHDLLRYGRSTFEGRFHTTQDAQMVLRGPSGEGPPIVVAAGGERMKRLAARFADEWNWWVSNEEDVERITDHLDDLERACDEVGRDPATLGRSLDVYAAALGDGDQTDEDIARKLLSLGDLGFAEVRCYLDRQRTHADTIASIRAMSPVIEHVHAG